MLRGHAMGEVIAVAAELGVVDGIEAGCADAGALADRLGVSADVLQRVLRALEACGMLARAGDGTFAVTGLGRTMRSGDPSEVRQTALFSREPWHWLNRDLWSHLRTAVSTGSGVFETLHGSSLYDHLAANPEVARTWNDFISYKARLVAGAVVRSYDFAAHRCVVDVGGGTGVTLAAILQAVPHLRGVLLDLPHVVGQLDPAASSEDVRPRLRAVGGDFRAAVPAGADLYLLKEVLHNWDDAACARILRSCREAGEAGATLLVVESLRDRGPAAEHVELMDLGMFLVFGGRQRSEREWRSLLEAASWRLRRIVTVPPGPLALIVAD